VIVPFRRFVLGSMRATAEVLQTPVTPYLI